METLNSNRNNIILRFLLASVLVYSLLGLFAGLPATANLGAFVAGLVILFVALVALMALVWYAVMKPLPEKQAASGKMPLSHGLRQGIALLLILMAGVGTAGGLWDVTWHVLSGLPFGEDFFWQPHQFIYVALSAPIIVAAFLWFRLMRNSTGTLRQRFRADIPVTVIMIGGIAMLFTLPADPLWHVIYGEDLTGLSVPHLVFSITGTLTTIGSLSILLSYTPVRKTWESIAKINWLDFLLILPLAFTFITLLMPTLGDWEALAISASNLPRLPALVDARPDWAMPFLAAFVAVFPTSMALHITKRIGTATLVWLIAAVIRSSLFLAFGYGDTGMMTMLLTLPFVVAVDLATWYRTSRNQPVSAVVTAAAATIAGAVAVLPQIPVFFTDPVLRVDNVPVMILAIFVAALTGTWMGTVLGGVVTSTVRFALPAEQPMIPKAVRRTITALTLVITSIAVFFIFTSTIPSA